MDEKQALALGRDMTLHLVKLCVGAESFDDHATWIVQTLESKRRRGLPAEQLHTTRMVPKHSEALTQGGSLYWVIKGVIQARQRLLEIRPFKDDHGIGRCHLVLDPTLVRTESQPRRPFQGWRYLQPQDAPPDIDERKQAALATMTPQMRSDLQELCLL